MAKVASACCTCCMDPLKQCSLDAHRHILVVAALNLLVEREWHPLTVVAVATINTTRDCPPLHLTAHCQHVAGGMVPPTAEGRPMVQAMELTNLCALLHKLQPPTLLAVLAHTLYSYTWKDMYSAALSSQVSSFGTGYSLQLKHWRV